MSGWVNF